VTDTNRFDPLVAALLVNAATNLVDTDFREFGLETQPIRGPESVRTHYTLALATATEIVGKQYVHVLAGLKSGNFPRT
jgi:hypothetical protein